MSARGTAPPGRPASLWSDLRVRLGLAGVLAVILVWRLASGGEVEPKVTQAAPGTPQAAGTELVAPKLGVRLRYPGAWAAQRGARVVRLRSPEGTLAVAVASPTSGRLPARILLDTERAMREIYKPARVLRHLPGRVGKLPALTVELAGRAGGVPVRVLAATVASRYRTYVIQVVSRVPPPAARLLEAQEILRSMAFTRPS